jgi:eukaryotic-like serine/threonine-protein kinase
VGVDLSKSEPQTDPLIGRTLDGRYEVLGRLGEGGVGVVYRGRQTHLGRFVAIKVLHQDAAGIPEWRRRFEREAKALSALAHPNVVPVTDFGIDGGVPFLVMELLQGKTLGDLIKEGPLPLGRALDIARQTLRGLAFAHGKGIVHRDLKPANVFLQELPDQADHVRLLDFGMAKFLEGSGSRTVPENLTRAGIVFGTPAYMSPEQVKAGAIDARSDVYAAGILMFELLAGRRPFLADSYEGYLGAHLTQPVPSLAKLRPKIPGARLFQTLIERAMAKKPADRFEDAGALLAELEAVMTKRQVVAAVGRPVAARGRPTPVALSVSPSGSRWGRRALTVVTLAAAIGAGAAYVWHDRTTPGEIATLPAERPPKAASPAAPAPTPAVPSAAPPPSPSPSGRSSSLELTAPQPPSPVPTESPAKAPAHAEREAPSEQPEQPEQPEAPDKQRRKPRSSARNPWKAPVPHALRPIRDRIDRGSHLSQRALAPVYEFAHSNPSDPRPWLLLGHAYAELDWYSDSVDRYVRADHVDSTCRGDPQMLADLLKAAAHPVAARGAARAIRDIYGSEAISAVDRAMKSSGGDREATARLARLRESLSH